MDAGEYLKILESHLDFSDTRTSAILRSRSGACNKGVVAVTDDDKIGSFRLQESAMPLKVEDFQDLVGLTFEEARAKGEALIVTMDFNASRLNVSETNGIIKSVDSVG